jgi:hypothetical protein
MNCFVIMPFAQEFDDVYSSIKAVFERVLDSEQLHCLRLDELQSAGRITDRLFAQLHASTICVADLTGLRPNVMWEVGFAMALGRPTIILTQDINTLPFDLKDMHSIEYDRARLTATLAGPLHRTALATIGQIRSESSISALTQPSGPNDAYATVLAEVQSLKTMLAETVRAWMPQSPLPQSTDADLRQLVGNWISSKSKSHMYSRIVNGALVTAYSYGGAEQLTGLYYDWRRVGEHWFARYKWLHDLPAGFAFLKQESADRLVGAWWDSDSADELSEEPPKLAGVTSTWRRQPNDGLPVWADRAIRDVEQRGLAAVLLGAKHRPRRSQ